MAPETEKVLYCMLAMQPFSWRTHGTGNCSSIADEQPGRGRRLIRQKVRRKQYGQKYTPV